MMPGGFGRVQRAGCLLAGKRIHVRAQRDGRSGRVGAIEIADDGVADAGISIAHPEPLELHDDSPGRVGLLERQLRVLVEPAAQYHQPLEQRLLDDVERIRRPVFLFASHDFACITRISERVSEHLLRSD